MPTRLLGRANYLFVILAASSTTAMQHTWCIGAYSPIHTVVVLQGPTGQLCVPSMNVGYILH